MVFQRRISAPKHFAALFMRLILFSCCQWGELGEFFSTIIAQEQALTFAAHPQDRLKDSASCDLFIQLHTADSPALACQSAEGLSAGLQR
jgi:hypothetical protein